jgi:hypothetical protein
MIFGIERLVNWRFDPEKDVQKRQGRPRRGISRVACQRLFVKLPPPVQDLASVDGDPGCYVAVRSTTGGTNAGTLFLEVVGSNMNNARGAWGAATALGDTKYPGFGLYSATSAGVPATMALTDIIGDTNVTAARPPYLVWWA